MKRFIVSILGVTVFCIGLGAIADDVGARFKSDDKALALIKQARIAIGGDQSIAGVRSMIIKGNTTVTFKVGSESRTEQGETEIAMQLPDKLSKMVKFGRHDGVEGDKIVSEKHDVIVMRRDGEGKGVGLGAGHGEKKVVVRKTDGGEDVEIEKIIAGGKDGEFTTKDGKKMIVRTGDGPQVEKVIVHGDKEGHMKMAGEAHQRHAAMRQNELLRTTLSLLLTAPEGMDVSFTYLGEGDVDGTTCNIVNAGFGGSNIKLYLSKASSLPVMVSYQGHAMPKIMLFRSKEPASADASKDVVMFNHQVEAPEMAEFNVRFSDFRGVDGVQLPFKWTTTVGGQPSEVFDVTGYEINPANIAERFQNQKVMVRTKKESN